MRPDESIFTHDVKNADWSDPPVYIAAAGKRQCKGKRQAKRTKHKLTPVR